MAENILPILRNSFSTFKSQNSRHLNKFLSDSQRCNEIENMYRKMSTIGGPETKQTGWNQVLVVNMFLKVLVISLSTAANLISRREQQQLNPSNGFHHHPVNQAWCGDFTAGFCTKCNTITLVASSLLFYSGHAAEIRP